MESRTLLWLMALAFSVVLLIQFVQLPYGSVLSSFGKSQEPATTGNFVPGRSYGDIGNSGSDQVPSMNTKMNGFDKFVNETMFSARKNGSREHDLTPELNMFSNGSSGVSHDTEVDHPSREVGRLIRNETLLPETAGEHQSNSEKSSSVQLLPVTSHVPTTSTLNRGESPESTSPQATFPPPNVDSPSENPANVPPNNSSPGITRIGLTSSGSNSSTKNKRFKGPPDVVVPISTMNDMLHKSLVSYQSIKPQWPSQVDKELLNVKMSIETADIIQRHPHIDINVYRNYSAFRRSYELMERTLKVYIYSEGERPVFHQPELSGIYASEGWFMKQLEENKHFVTKTASKAHLFYLPFSSRVLEETLYVKGSHSRKNMVEYLSNYLRNIKTRYNYWNRTSGADHFIVACHDWAPAETKRIMKNCIRALCNADVQAGLQFSKDVSLPEIYVHDEMNPLKSIGGKPPSQRHILAFFAGSMHGYLRPILLNYWKDSDPDIKIFGKLRPAKGQTTYKQYMQSSKYCISAKGYESYTPRVMEAIFHACVPVIISDNYVPPFLETLNWGSFAVFILEKDIPNLKRILTSIPKQKYLKMQERVRQVQKHFLWHRTPVKHDVFHMILHSVWYTRVFQMRPW